ncbi:MAG: fused MFS/spermidine synthase [bacterium]|nr:fused MFS/spermidine synthase [bacterium]
MKKYLLEITVFISGAVVMIFELVGSRVMGPYVGTSTFVWTSLIGVILASLSIGYWLGGKFADKKASYKILSLIILMAGVLIGTTTFIKDFVMIMIQEGISDIRVGSIIGAIILFALPSILLGMVSPYAVKLKMNSLDTSGKTVGNLYAISTTGSIVGTFSAGFFLIPFLGNTKILLLLAILLTISSSLIYLKKYWLFKTTLLLFFLLFNFITIPSPLIAIEGSVDLDSVDLDTEYSRIWIFNDIDNTTGQPIKKLQINTENNSAMFLENDELVSQYTKFYRLADHFFPNLKTALMLGGAAYSYPKDFLNKHESATIDVVEIDPMLTELAREHFRLVDDPKMNIIHEDGRTYLNTTEKKYDVILGDAFTSFYSIPYQLSTVEAVEKTYDLLNDNGVVILNIASAIEGDGGKFLRAELATYQEIFPQTYIFPVIEKDDGEKFQNIILVAIKSDQPAELTSLNKEFDGYLSNLWTKDIPNDMPILTDDHAPVDYYINEAINEIF